MKDTAFILECNVSRQRLSSYPDVQVTHSQRSNRFGLVDALEIENLHGNAVIYEEGGMNGRYTLPQTHLPIYTDIYRRKIKNVYLLGFCGSLTPMLKIGSFVIPASFIDLTKKRERSYLEALCPGELFFYRMSKPYSPTLQATLLQHVRDIGLPATEIENYVITEGPRFESTAEIQTFGKIGGQAVCFSGIPDVYFARELDLNFCCGLFVSNLAEGLPDAALEDILHTSIDQTAQITDIVVSLLDADIDITTDAEYHLQYWMQKPSPGVYDLIFS